MKKRSILIISVATLLALLVVGGTMAWFTSNPEAVDNKFTAGTVKVEVNEHGFEPIIDWNPGDTTPKEVSVKSLGSKKTYVRVQLTPVWEGNLPINNVVLNWNEEDWVESNGWYYYKHILNKDGETSNLLNSVTLRGPETDDTYQGKILTVTVKAEAVQASHDAYKDVWGLTSLPTGVEIWQDPNNTTGQ